ncbi:integrase core domain-containing protein [Pectinatus brassicae]|uniref:Transposase InsO family protein n=1 Tax=Pectinatus brassicae TaxID=862415 RepID=A0A840UE09_9FIRM|nr:IS3 family transposase [Pectinatus brassicae]MBB5335346.1 transposase InsO family protein [Pectinatus brassicae]
MKQKIYFVDHFHTRKQAQSAIFRYIETYYNAVRPHSGIGWKAPNGLKKFYLFPIA